MAALAAQWAVPAPRLAPASRSLELPLRPWPALRRAVALTRLLLALSLVDTLLHGQWLAAAAHGPLLALLVAGHGPWRISRTPRRLLVTSGGELFIVEGVAGPRGCRLAAASQWLGQAVLLVLDTGPSHREYLWLGPGNVDPVTLAALRRRLRRTAAGEVSAIHSRFALRTGTAPPDATRR